VLYDAVALEDPPDAFWSVWTDPETGCVPDVETLSLDWVAWALPACRALAEQAEVATAAASMTRFGADIDHGQASLQQSASRVTA
jgi:hypothetical protein